MLLEKDLPGLLGKVSDRVTVPDLVAGVHRRHRRRRLLRAGSVIAVVALLATGTTAVIAQRTSTPGVLRSADGTASLVPANDYASVEESTHDVILVSADTGEHTLVHANASPSDWATAAFVSPSRRYVYWVSYDRLTSVESIWRVLFARGDPQRLPSASNADPVKDGGDAGSLAISADDTEYAYPDPAFTKPQRTYVQQVSGGAPVDVSGVPFDSDKAQIIGFHDDATLLELSTSATAATVVATDIATGRRGIVDTRSIRTTPDCVDTFDAALLADGRIASVPEICNVDVQPTVRVVDPVGRSVRTWVAPVRLFAYGEFRMKPLPDGRLVVSYQTGHCAGTAPVVIFSPDGTSVPAYGRPLSSLHC